MKWTKAIRLFLSRTTGRDNLMLVNMILLLVMGVVMILRAFQLHGLFLAYAIGSGLMLAGLYRCYLVYKILGQIAESLCEEITDQDRFKGAL